RHQDAPEIVAVLEPRKPAVGYRRAKTLEGAQCDIFLVRRRARHAPESSPSQSYELRKVAFPEPLRGVGIASFQLAKPSGYRSTASVHHRPFAPSPPGQTHDTTTDV